jgi:hypothetical protein
MARLQMLALLCIFAVDQCNSFVLSWALPITKNVVKTETLKTSVWLRNHRRMNSQRRQATARSQQTQQAADVRKYIEEIQLVSSNYAEYYILHPWPADMQKRRPSMASSPMILSFGPGDNELSNCLDIHYVILVQ